MGTIIISNRIATPKADAPVAGGLAAALLPAVQESGAIWVGGSGRLAKAGEPSTMTLTPLGKGNLAVVDLPASDYPDFYNGMSNAAIWPIFHFRPDLLTFEESWFRAYRNINKVMADNVVKLLDDSSLIWVHDYHFLMLGEALRKRGVRKPIGFFLHIPFPTRSLLTCLPRHEELCRAMLSYDLIGFQTEEDLHRFRDYAINELRATATTQTALSYGDRKIRLGVFPISIDAHKFAKMAAKAMTLPKVARLRQALGNDRIVIGVDRLDYSKGLPERFRAYERLLTTYPEERRKVSFLQITPPTRSDVDAYKDIRNKLAGMAGDINGRFSDLEWTALRYINEGIPPGVLAGFYRLADVGCVTPLRDGMNLVAKEYVASQSPEDPGVLVLSKFAGVAKEFGAALLVNPYDVDEVAGALKRGLHMSLPERRERWTSMMRSLRGNDLTNWFDSFLAALRVTRAPTPVISFPAAQSFEMSASGAAGAA